MGAPAVNRGFLLGTASSEAARRAPGSLCSQRRGTELPTPLRLRVLPGPSARFRSMRSLRGSWNDDSWFCLAAGYKDVVRGKVAVVTARDPVLILQVTALKRSRK